MFQDGVDDGPNLLDEDQNKVREFAKGVFFF